MPNAAFVYDDALSLHVLRSDHPMRPVRLRHTYELLSAYGAFDGDTSRLINPRSATEEELEWVHTPEYIAAVRALSAGPSTVRPEPFGFSALGDNPVYPGMYDAASLSSGATLVAAELVAGQRVDVAFSISGGLHHAAPTHAYGFCIFNDPAIAIKYFLERGMRVAYVDVDAHHGDGVFYSYIEDERIIFLDFHQHSATLYPGTGKSGEVGTGHARGTKLNVELLPQSGDEAFFDQWERAREFIDQFSPQFVLFQCGVDSLRGDPITDLRLSEAAHRFVTEELIAYANEHCAGRLLALGGGGYNLENISKGWTAVTKSMVNA